MLSVSDEYHTMTELYEHRHALFCALCRVMPDKAWRSRCYPNGIPVETGWFLAGLFQEPNTQISYHLPDSYWDSLDGVTGVQPAFDGHVSSDVIARLNAISPKESE